MSKIFRLLILLGFGILSVGEASASRKYLALYAPPARKEIRYYLKSDGQKLALYTKNQKLLWATNEWNEINDAILGDDDNLYLAVPDGLLLCLDLTGKKIWSNFMNGAANYVQIVPYRKNGFLVRLDHSGYRAYHEKIPISDSIAFYQDQQMKWTKEFPANAQVKVRNDKIYAVYFRQHRRVQKRIP